MSVSDSLFLSFILVFFPYRSLFSFSFLIFFFYFLSQVYLSLLLTILFSILTHFFPFSFSFPLYPFSCTLPSTSISSLVYLLFCTLHLSFPFSVPLFLPLFLLPSSRRLSSFIDKFPFLLYICLSLILRTIPPFQFYSDIPCTEHRHRDVYRKSRWNYPVSFRV